MPENGRNLNTERVNSQKESQVRVRLLPDVEFSGLSVWRTRRGIGDSYSPKRFDYAKLKKGYLLAGKYELVERLKHGGMSCAVWTAIDRRMNNGKRVVKFLNPSISIREENEVKILADLTHSNICRLWDVLQEPPALVLGRVEGQDLATYIQELKWKEKGVEERLIKLLKIIQQIAEGLDHSHRSGGIVHCDIKPANIFTPANISTDERDKHVDSAKLGDFGLACIITEDTKVLGGTYPYMPPEQIVQMFKKEEVPLELRNISIGPAADIYSLASTVYECLTLQRLIQADNLLDCRKEILELKLPEIKELSEKTNRAIKAALSELPKDRPATATDFAKLLDPTLYITTKSLPIAYIGHPYTFKVQCEGGQVPYNWKCQISNAGANFLGELRCTTDGFITGLLNTSDNCFCTIDIQISVEDAGGRHLDIRTFKLEIRPKGSLRIATYSLPTAFCQKSYSFQLEARGGQPPYEWQVEGFPKRVECSFEGKLVVNDLSSGCYQGKIKVTDSDGARREQDLLLTVVSYEDYAVVEVETDGKGDDVGLSSEDAEKLSQRLQIPVEHIRTCFSHGQVSLQKFAIKSHPVSNKEYSEFIRVSGYNSSSLPSWWNRIFNPNASVSNISFEDAIAYCRWRGTRLPTIAEWEVAYRKNCSLKRDHFDEWINSRGPIPQHQIQTTRGSYRLPVSIDDQRAFRPDRITWWRYRLDGNGLFLYLPIIPKDNNDERDKFTTFRDVVDLTPTLRPEQTMIYIKGGWFKSGPENERRYVSEFEISKYAVSNVEYAEIVKHWKSDFGEALLPAVNVRLDDAKAFCDRLTNNNQDGYIYSLPSSFQWERAARGVEEDNSLYPWGNEYDRYRCNSLESGHGRRVKVCELPLGKSIEGLFNMCGNVSEWVDDGTKSAAMGGNYLCNCKHFGLPYMKEDFHEDGDALVGFRYIRRKIH